MDQTYESQIAATPTDDARSDFLKKTYSHLLGAVVAFIALETFLFTSGIAAAIAGALAGNWLIVLGGFMVVGWLASRFANGERPLSQQYLGLALFIVAEAIIFVPLLAVAIYFSDASVLSNAIYTTAGVFALLTAFVHTTKTDFSFLRPFLMVIGIAALVAIVASFLFNVTLGFYFSVGMAVFAAAAVLHDTSAVLREYRTGQHVAAALRLFASVALLFYYILSIFISRD